MDPTRPSEPDRGPPWIIHAVLSAALVVLLAWAMARSMAAPPPPQPVSSTPLAAGR